MEQREKKIKFAHNQTLCTYMYTYIYIYAVPKCTAQYLFWYENIRRKFYTLQRKAKNFINNSHNMQKPNENLNPQLVEIFPSKILQ